MRDRVIIALSMMVALLLACGAPTFADEPFPEDDLALAQRYAPVFYFHPDEVFLPQPVDVIVEQARLRQSRPMWFDINILVSLTVPDLLKLESDTSYFLDVWYGDGGSSAYANYSAHQAYYQAMLSPHAGGPPTAVYAHVVRDEVEGYITIQYWAFYYYNDWFNKHEGDWEMVEVILTENGVPEWVVLSQHHGGTRRAWSQAPVEDTTHPAAYVALGSHANYFVPDEVYPNGKDIGNERIEIMDRTGAAGRTIPEVIMLPDRQTASTRTAIWPGTEWLSFRGHWGELAAQSDFGGPLGPADKGTQWETPHAWGMAQPLDTDEWYANRLRVEVSGPADHAVQVLLTEAQSSALPHAESLGNMAIAHADPPATGARAEITAVPGARYDISVQWPSAEDGLVTRMQFDDVWIDASGQTVLEIAPDGLSSAQVRVDGTVKTPSATDTASATWDAPDLIWIGSILPAHQLVAGILWAVAAAVVPALLYATAIYWTDRYEKEPRHLLAAAFWWGALPAVLMAFVVELFFSLPPNLIGPQALEAVRLGLVAPVLQEALKGVIVLIIAWRYRREFDNVLDGIIYGSMVGLGFAMTGNLISYVGSFLLWGFDGLHTTIILEGVIRGLDSALYTAIFGAGLGLGRLARQRWQRWVFPAGAFVMAVVVHALHNVLSYSLLGLNTITVLLTVSGLVLIIVVVVWSLKRQEQCLRAELKGLVPDDVYQAVLVPKERARAQWRALRRRGLRAWWLARQLHRLCTELAFKRMQSHLRPDETEIKKEMDCLQEKVNALVQKLPR
jgi:RsiW-degrading membrane proteinase PrsW (M82 family)